MRLQVFSDVHFDVAAAFTPQLAPDVDAVVVAGDVCQGMARGMSWLRAHLGDKVPIVMVAGNHEFFHTVRSEERAAGLAAAAKYNISLLDDASIEIHGTRFVGATLWCDFDLFGEDMRPRVMAAAERVMLDHHMITEDPELQRRFSAEDARRQHMASRTYLERALAQSFSGPTVVVTHHGPHEKSVARKFREDIVTPAFISDLSAVIERYQPPLWIHGHTHTSFDYRVRGTRVLCNPHGYGFGQENPQFEPAMVVEV
ncbi:MAG: metallophosphoesterase [Hyphomicrobiaceae bacterium]